jgi:hypothetical protein
MPNRRAKRRTREIMAAAVLLVQDVRPLSEVLSGTVL